MKFVVDSNVIFTFFWKDATATELFVFQDVELYTPEFTLKEIEKYSKEIMKKGKIEQKEFIDVKKELQMLITFVSLEKYKELLEKALNVTPDPDDVDFFALALKMNLPIWSNDKKLKQQNIVKILTTKEVIELFD